MKQQADAQACSEVGGTFDLWDQSAVAAPEVGAAVAEWRDCKEDPELLEAEAEAAGEETEAQVC